MKLVFDIRLLLLGILGVILTVIGVFGNKYSQVYTRRIIYYNKGVPPVCTAINCTLVFTTGTGYAQIIFVTSGGGTPTLFSDASCSNVVVGNISLVP